MVDNKKVERKLADLLVNGEASTRKPAEWNEYMKKRQRLITFKRQHPKEFQTWTSRVVNLLEQVDEALYRDLITMDRNLTVAVRETFGKKKRS